MQPNARTSRQGTASAVVSSIVSDLVGRWFGPDKKPRQDDIAPPPPPPAGSDPHPTFVVKLRSPDTRSWGNQVEVQAATASDAAEWLAGERLIEGSGQRDDLRVSLWSTPFGSSAPRLFYVEHPA